MDTLVTSKCIGTVRRPQTASIQWLSFTIRLLNTAINGARIDLLEATAYALLFALQLFRPRRAAASEKTGSCSGLMVIPPIFPTT